MEIAFKTRKLGKELSTAKGLAGLGAVRAKRVRARPAELRAANTLLDLWPPYSPPGRCHELSSGSRSAQLSVDLDHPYRLIFVPDYNPIPTKPEGGLDRICVKRVKILGVEDTHG